MEEIRRKRRRRDGDTSTQVVMASTVWCPTPVQLCPRRRGRFFFSEDRSEVLGFLRKDVEIVAMGRTPHRGRKHHDVRCSFTLLLLA